jgi:hypothetical protein
VRGSCQTDADLTVFDDNDENKIEICEAIAHQHKLKASGSSFAKDFGGMQRLQRKSRRQKKEL